MKSESSQYNFECQVAGTEPAGSVGTGLGTPAAPVEYLAVHPTPPVPSFTLLLANAQGLLIPPLTLLPIGRSSLRPAHTSSQF